MAQPDDLRYTLVINKVEYILPHSPSGWEESLLNWERSGEYFGMIKSFSVPMVFVLDGAWLLRKEFYEKGLKAETVIRIDLLDRSTWKYRNIFTGEIDYSTFQDRLHEVEVAVMEGGISKMVKAYDKVQYEISLDDPEAIEVIIPGIGVVEKASAISTPFTMQFLPILFPLLGVNIITNELYSQLVTAQTVEPTQEFGPTLLPDSDLWFLKGEEESDVRIAGYLTIRHRLRYSTAIQILVVNQHNVVVASIAKFISRSLDGVPQVIPFDFSYKISGDERLFLGAKMEGTMQADPNLPELIIEEGEINITNTGITSDTVTKALRPKTLMDRLLAKMNNGFAVESQSFLLTNDNWSRLVITSGDAIRSFPDPVIKTSFRDFFEAMNAIIGVGFGVESGVAVLEEKSYWMRSGLQAVHIGEVKGFNLEVATNYIYNSIKVGYQDQNYEVAYGRDEYNSTQTWTTPITRVQKELNLISPYRADQLGIEDLRLTSDEQNQDRQDKSSDNDVFVIKIQPTPIMGQYQVEGSEAYREGDGIRGVEVRNSYYNLDITPKKNLIRHGDFLRSMLHHYDGRHIRFESAEKNQWLKTIDLAGNTVTENEWLPISSLPDRIFLPYLATVTSALPKNAAETISHFPTGYVRFSYMGHEYTGFIISASVDVARNSEREFKLLLTPGNNLLNLVH